MYQTRAICVTADPGLRKILRRSLCAAGSVVEFVNDADEVLALPDPRADILLVDEPSKQRAKVEQILAKLNSRVIVLGDGIDHEDSLRLLRAKGCDHLIAREDVVDEEELVVTTVKLLSGDIFGMEKYLTWGITIHEREVSGYDDKRAAIAAVAEHASEVGCRRQMVARIETTCDELLMNALYDAPAAANGRAATAIALGEAGAPALLRYGCDGKFFGVSVRDTYGALRKQNILDNLERAKDEQGSPRAAGHSESGGAGLGLYFILNCATRFIANIQPGRATEVVCLFDMRGSARDFHYRAKSLNIFLEEEPPGHA
ncbi:MAG TPA: hypothetical protein VKN99_22795 [Polyangia bacterium]|nr:hypothetical protein [Polyangia bacterium]